MTVGRGLTHAVSAVLIALVVLLALPALAAAQPVLTFTQPLEGSATKGSMPTFAGTTTDPNALDPITLEILNESATVVQTMELLPVAGTWEATLPTGLGTDGAYTALVKQTEGSETASSSVTFTLDTTKPVVSLEPISSPSNNATPTLTGSAGALPGDDGEVTVTIYEGGTVGGGIAQKTKVPVSSGSWTYSAAHLNDGTYTALVLQEDAVGNIGESSAVTFTVDTTAPAVSLTSPKEGVLHIARPTFSGSAGQAGGDHQSVTLKIYAGPSAAGSPSQTLENIVPSGSKWSTGSSGPALKDGIYTALVEQTDEAGNTGTATVTFAIETNSPTVTMNTSGATRGSGLITGRTPTFGGTGGTGEEDGTTILIKIYSGSVASGTPVSTFETPLSGSSWTAPVPGSLPDGNYTAQAQQADSDPLGETGFSSPLSFTVDGDAPHVTLSSPVGGSSSTGSSEMVGGAAGTAEGDSQTVNVQLFSGTSVTGPSLESILVQAAAGAWSGAFGGLTAGTYTARAEQRDDVGNVGYSAPVTFVIETGSPKVTLEASGAKRGERLLTGPTPTFSGTAAVGEEDGKSILLKIYAGAVASGTALRTVEAPLNESKWTAPPLPALPDGGYTARAEQTDSGKAVFTSLSFTVDGDAPHVTLSSPASGSSSTGSSEMVGGAAGTAEGDSQTVDVQLFSGTSVAGPSLGSISVQAASGAWSGAFGGLTAGTYTARAEQRDDVGNVGYSAPTTFTVLPPLTPSPSPPVASFQWFPASPQAGEQVSLVSTSTDAGSAVTGFAWGLTPTAALTPGEHVLSTTFATAGAHVVRLRVSDAAGLSSEVSDTVMVTPPRLTLMQPFPVVRIAGSAKKRSIRITLFTVQAPVGATVSVACHGHGCPAKPQQFVVASKAKSNGTVLTSFGRFERLLKAGAVLEIKVFMRGEIGKYTRFTVRRGKLPARVDSCLNPVGTRPMSCPSS